MAVNFTDESPSYFSCAEWDQNFEIVHTKALRTSYLWTCILNGVLAIHTAILNSLIVVLYFKDKRLQTTANVLILALAFSDLVVALVIQPAVVVNNALRFHEIYSCVSELTTFALTAIGVGLSCSTVCFTITLERLFAICWPLKHRVLVTKSLLKKIFLGQVALHCVIVFPFILNSSLKFSLEMQSGSIIFGIIFVLAAYLCIFIIIHKRFRAVAKNGLTTDCLEKVSRNSKQKKISGKDISQDSKRADKSPDDVSQYSMRTDESTDNVSQYSRRTDESTDNVSQDSKLENKSTIHISQDSKEKSNSPKYVSQNSMPRNKPPKNVSQGSKRERNLDENLSQNSNRNSLEILSHDSNGKEMKIPDNKLKDEQRTFSACVSLQKARLKLKQELRVCKAMAVIAGAVALCFLPRAVIFKYVVSGAISMETFYNYLIPWFDVLAFVNSSLNPYIYFFHNKDITEGVKKIIFGKKNTQLNKTNLPTVEANIKR
ncbi:octopamine receptor [Paramuricea clavata]|uniref:Octopamine receptor n=1 Tax=Paramuricea clavata TaxID=317549 RepID=A0A6S7GBR5_PARCT|nr:octopamine receptor [Paramuricea clavata]